MSRNSRSTNGRDTKRNAARSRQTGPLAATARTSGRLTIKEAACRKAGTGANLRHRSHYAAVGASALPRRAGRRS